MRTRIWIVALSALSMLAAVGVVRAQVTAAPPAESPQPYPNEPAPGTQIVHPIDGAIMVWIPSGYFTMGEDRQGVEKLAKALGYDDPDKIAAYEWYPKRREYVTGFFMDKHEITRHQWGKFCAATNYTARKAIGHKETRPGEYAMHPVAQVHWNEAQLYANWSGKQLPTEAQWEKAARGTDGRTYPWGNEPPTKDRGVFPGDQGPESEGKTIFQPVGSRPAGVSPYGCMDMSGNLYEWTREWMEPYPNNPEFQKMLSYTGHKFGCLRGGSFYHAMHALGCAKRFGFEIDETYFHVGFRTMWQPPRDYFGGEAFRKAREAVAARQAELDQMRKDGTQNTPYWGG